MAAGGIRLESHPLFSVCLEALRGLPATRGSRRGGDARRGGGRCWDSPKSTDPRWNLINLSLI